MAPFGSLHTIDRGIFVHPPSRFPLALAAYCGLDVQIPSGFEWAKSNKTPEYLGKFPLGKIPSFEGADGFCLTESKAIAYYLAESCPDPAKKEALLGADVKTRAKVHQWMFFAGEHISAATSPLVGWRLGFGIYNKEADERHAADLKRWLDYVEASLKGKKWLVDGDGPSLGDFAVACAIMGGILGYIDAPMLKEYPEIERHLGQIKAIPELTTLFEIKILEAHKVAPDS